MKKIVLLKGGVSNEREISLVSAEAVELALVDMGYEVYGLDPMDYPSLAQLLQKIKEYDADLVFNALHGGAGEDGRLQAALELENIAYTGSDSKSSALAMDKYVSKLIALAEGIPCAKHILLRGNLIADYNDEQDYAEFAETLGLPIIVKPNVSGSSVGISMVENLAQLKPAVELALEHCPVVLLEEYIAGREITVSILDRKSLPVVEIRPKSGWYDYLNKYTSGKTEYLAPAPLEESISQLAQLYAERIYSALGCSVYARVDFRIRDGKCYFLEVNTLPGMTKLSLTPMAAAAAGLSFPELLKTIIDISIEGS